MYIKALKKFYDRKDNLVPLRLKDEEFYTDDEWGKYLIAQGYAEEVKDYLSIRNRGYTETLTEEEGSGGNW